MADQLTAIIQEQLAKRAAYTMPPQPVDSSHMKVWQRGLGMMALSGAIRYGRGEAA
ncbi:hypothetical protein WMW72_21505 [Paenibacillus filicis]|uniref:Uncharacterized protein n=1 Tax=Paenibacillus filicis TaxID=669464 RepID=A0ABU9DQX8_9BACL